MNVVAHLFALVAVDFVKPTLEIALDQVAEKSMQLDPAVIRTGEATAAQAAAAQAEVSSIFLNHDVAGDFGSAKETMLALIDRQIFTNPLGERRIVIVPTAGKLPELDGIGAVTVHLVGAHVDKDGLRRVAANGFQQIESSTSVDVEIIERARGGQVVAGLRSGVDQQRRSQLVHAFENLLSIADIQLMVLECGVGRDEPAAVPARIAGGPEEIGTLIVIDAINGPALAGKMPDNFGPDQSR